MSRPARPACFTALATIYRANGSTRPLTASAVTRDLPPGERRRSLLGFRQQQPHVEPLPDDVGARQRVPRPRRAELPTRLALARCRRCICPRRPLRHHRRISPVLRPIARRPGSRRADRLLRRRASALVRPRRRHGRADDRARARGDPHRVATAPRLDRRRPRGPTDGAPSGRRGEGMDRRGSRPVVPARRIPARAG